MLLNVALPDRYVRTPDGCVWTPGASSYAFWQRYLDVFEAVQVIARVKDVAAVPAGLREVGGPAVAIAALPHFVGPRQYLLKAKSVTRAVHAAVQNSGAIILRVPCQQASCLHRSLLQSGRPYAVEVVGDPYDSFAPGSVRHPLRPLFRWWLPRQLRRQCFHACAATYVTQRALQLRYPVAPGKYSMGCSDVELPEEAFAKRPHTLSGPGAVRLICVGTMDQMYKAQDVLIDAVAECSGGGLDVRLVLVGEGKHRAELEARATRLGLCGKVRFTGQVAAGESVRKLLDAADVFVLPSYQEGLPRAMVEAMARGLPCLGSTAGGIPELLPSDCLVPPGNSGALARTIRECATNTDRLNAMASRSLEVAREYHESILQSRRRDFLRYVQQVTEEWFNKSH